MSISVTTQHYPLVEEPEAALTQIHRLIKTMNDDWVKERLSQIARFHEGPCPLDLVIKKELENFSNWLDCSVEEHFVQNCKKISLKNLKTIFEIATISCYRSANVAGSKVQLFAKVSSDGWGDYVQMRLAANNLKEELPSAKIQCHATVDTHRDPPSLELPQKLEPFQENDPETDLTIVIPHGHISNTHAKSAMRVEENGFNPGNDLALGFSSTGNNVIGILIPPEISENSLSELTNAPLLAQLTQYNRPFFMGYLKADSMVAKRQSAGFVLAAVASHPNKTDDLDIISPLSDVTTLDLEALKALSVGRIVFEKADQAEVIILQPEGREIRFLSPFPVSNRDWRLLLKFCAPLVGCTGDASFAEVVEVGKIPFYQIRGHKGPFFRQLLELSGYTYQEEFPQLHKLFLQMESTLAEQPKTANVSQSCLDIGQGIDLSTVLEARQFSDRVKRHYSANKILADIVKRQFAHIKNSSLEEYETHLYQDWTQSKLTLTEVCLLLQSKLQASDLIRI